MGIANSPSKEKGRVNQYLRGLPESQSNNPQGCLPTTPYQCYFGCYGRLKVVLSTLDLLSGCWQVEVKEGDRSKTAFCKMERLFQIRVMPFGLCNAPATFQRLMDLVLSGLQWSHCLVYLDDIIILGTTFKDHLCNILSILRRLREAGLKLKPSKCSFFEESLNYLGHIIS